MKKLAKILLTIVIAVVILATAVYAYYGGFRSVDFVEKKPVVKQ